MYDPPERLRLVVPEIAPEEESAEEAAERRKSWGEALPRTSACIPCLLAREHCYPSNVVVRSGGKARACRRCRDSRLACLRSSGASSPSHPRRPMLTRMTELGCDVVGQAIDDPAIWFQGAVPLPGFVEPLSLADRVGRIEEAVAHGFLASRVVPGLSQRLAAMDRVVCALLLRLSVADGHTSPSLLTFAEKSLAPLAPTTLLEVARSLLHAAPGELGDTLETIFRGAPTVSGLFGVPAVSSDEFLARLAQLAPPAVHPPSAAESLPRDSRVSPSVSALASAQSSLAPLPPPSPSPIAESLPDQPSAAGPVAGPSGGDHDDPMGGAV